MRIHDRNHMYMHNPELPLHNTSPKITSNITLIKTQIVQLTLSILSSLPDRPQGHGCCSVDQSRPTETKFGLPSIPFLNLLNGIKI